MSCRKEEEQDPDLTVQLDVFDEQKANDDEALPGPQGVDLNSHLDVFHAVFKQVSTWDTLVFIYVNHYAAGG